MAVPQQMGQQLQQLAQPLQQLTSMFGSGGKADSLGAAGLPFSSFSNHPLAGGSGAGGGSGMVKAASLPGSGGTPLQTPQMSNLVGTKSRVGKIAAYNSYSVFISNSLRWNIVWGTAGTARPAVAIIGYQRHIRLCKNNGSFAYGSGRSQREDISYSVLNKIC
jgi:hypothetical protein